MQQIVNLHNISWKKEGKQILQDVSWTVQNGEHWVIVGNNGSGKTSLLNLLHGYVWPSTGRATVLGHHFGQSNMQNLRESLSLVSTSVSERQKSGHPEDSALEVVISGLFSSIGVYREVDPEDIEKGYSALALFGVRQFSDRLFQSLSQGEQQRVLLARAWIRQPQLMILDEPCTGLDIKTREDLLSAVEQLGRQQNGPSLLYVTHHIEEIMPAFTHVLALKDGKVIASGDKHSVLNDETLSSLFDLPVAVSWSGDRPWIQVKS
ncbi:ABC transporter ATP-binding protein [Alicyclobacillus sp. SO9]|uniref:ABC transporter ATP-binding protein n=1 Tax=Alicyclobacillus sp. SO9 TaxID=2665646 RepID=UPI0018E7B0B9|nr:ATP-binding cassette domain-containing protein [Alicyclobacillus sp. SO9]